MTTYIFFLNPSSLWSHWLSKVAPSNHSSALGSLPSGTSVPSEHTFRVSQASWRMTQETFPPVMDRIVSPQNSYVEALALIVTVFGDRTFILIDMKWGPTDGSQSDGGGALIRSGRGTGTRAGSPSLLTCGDSGVRSQQAGSSLQPGRQLSPETKVASTYYHNCEETEAYCLSYPVRGILLWRPELTNNMTASAPGWHTTYLTPDNWWELVRRLCWQHGGKKFYFSHAQKEKKSKYQWALAVAPTPPHTPPKWGPNQLWAGEKTERISGK